MEPMTAEESRARSYTVLPAGDPVQSRVEIKRSEFIGRLQRVTTEEQARTFIEQNRKTYHDARHVCSAFVIGPDREIQRSADDGEPAGTAGIPMLQTLLQQGGDSPLSDVCAVVIRYFGGIKLGAGGLVRAYTETVTQTLQEARLITRTRMRRGKVVMPHAEAGRLENELRAQGEPLGLTVLNTEYGQQATLQLAVMDQPESIQQAEALLASLSAGEHLPTWTDTEWIDRS